VKKLIRILTAAVLVTVAVRVMDWLLAPALPLLGSLIIMTAVAYVVLFGRRSL
jgi:hypothetical protein